MLILQNVPATALCATMHHPAMNVLLDTFWEMTLVKVSNLLVKNINAIIVTSNY